MPLHWLGLLTQSHMLPDAERIALASVGSSFRTFVTVATISTVAAQILFVFNFFGTLWKSRKASEENNPWRATTLEWSIPSPAPEDNFGHVFQRFIVGPTSFTKGFRLTSCRSTSRPSC